MTIIRGPRPDSRFVTVDKAISEDIRLSWAARGLLVFLLGKPDHWRVSVKHLMTQTENAFGNRSGRDAVRGLLQELQQAGYVRAVQARDAVGRLAGTDYIVSEQADLTPIVQPPALAGDDAEDFAEGLGGELPQTGLPAPDLPATDKPAPANPHLVSNEVKASTEYVANTERSSTRTRKRPASPATPLPADFVPTDNATQYASAHGLHLPTELANFKKKATDEAWESKNWAQSFRTWLTNSVQYKAKQAAKRSRAGGAFATPTADKDYSEGIGEDGSF